MSIETGEIPEEYRDLQVPALSLEQEPTQDELNRPEVKRNLNFFRSKVMRALMFGGYLAAMEACGPSEAEVQALPKIALGDLAKDPQKYVDMPMIRTEGHPVFERIDREVTVVPGIKAVGKRIVPTLNTVYRTREYYKLVEGVELTKAGSVEIYFNRGTEPVAVGVARQLGAEKFIKKLPFHNFRIVGQMKHMKNDYAIEVMDSLDLDQPAEKPESVIK